MERVMMARGFLRQPRWKIAIGVPLVYLPLLTTIPFVVITALIVRLHLTCIGAQNVRSYWSFVPGWVSHRYRYANQITYVTGANWHSFRHYRFYWVFNCKLYCPLSVALFGYLAYLVKVVENWWCPFDHDKKRDYYEGAVDRSYWHLYASEAEILHPDDRDNPIWNASMDGGVQASPDRQQPDDHAARP